MTPPRPGFRRPFICHFRFPADHGTPTSSVENALLAALPQEGFHALDAWWRGAALPVPLELVHVLPEDVARAQRADQIVEFRLVLSPVGPAAAKKARVF